MTQKKYISLNRLSTFLDNLKTLFVTKTEATTELAKKSDTSHTHSEYAPKASPTFTGSVSMGRLSGTTTGSGSVALGSSTTASGFSSTAMGESTTASGYCSQAFGNNADATGDYAFATGVNTTAQGETSTAIGKGNTAVDDCSFVHGSYSDIDTDSNYAHVVGIGKANARANGYTLDWSGNGWFKGDVYVGGTGVDSATATLVKSTDIIPITSGGTGASTYKTALANLHALETTTESHTYYIDAENGSDSNDGLSTSTAFKTIQHAIDIIPKYITHPHYIRVAEGTYDEDVTIANFMGRNGLQLIGASSSSDDSVNIQNASSYKVKSITVSMCGNGILIRGFEFTGSNNNYCINIQNAKDVVQIYACKSTGTAQTGVYVRNGKVLLMYFQMLNKTRGFVGGSNSMVYIQGLTGESNTTMLRVLQGGQIACSTPITEDMATTAYVKELAGMIILRDGTLA